MMVVDNETGKSYRHPLKMNASEYLNNDFYELYSHFQDGTFVPIFPNTSVLTPPGHKECGDFHDIRNVVFVGLQGKSWEILYQ